MEVWFVGILFFVSVWLCLSLLSAAATQRRRWRATSPRKSSRTGRAAGSLCDSKEKVSEARDAVFVCCNAFIGHILNLDDSFQSTHTGTNLQYHLELRVPIITFPFPLRILPVRLIFVELPHPRNIRRDPKRSLAHKSTYYERSQRLELTKPTPHKAIPA